MAIGMFFAPTFKKNYIHLITIIEK